jgi:hypothetical protein
VKRAPCLLALLALLAGAGCGVSSSGDFDGVPFAPSTTAFAVADRHDLIGSGGSLIAVKRSETQQRLHVFLSAAALDAGVDWRHLTAERLLNLKKEVATVDGLLLTDLPVQAALAGEDLEVTLDETGRRGAGDFGVEMVVGLPSDELVAEQSFGADVSVKVLFDDVVVEPRGGHVGARVEIKRERAEDQPEGEVATGEVTLTFTAPIAPERMSKSNLSLIAPVMRCAAEAGPAAAGRCRDEPPDPFVDATGTLVEP